MDRIQAAQVFVETVARGSISAAAEHLRLSRAMATRYLAAMEEWAGARLLHRTTRTLSLTAAGEQLLPVCRELLSLSRDVSLAAAAVDAQPRGLLRITAPTLFAEHCLGDALVAFLARYPTMSIDLQVLDRTINLAEEAIDLAIRITQAPDPQLIARKLGDCPSVMCASPAYLQSQGRPSDIRDLAAHNCLTYEHFGKSIWRFTRAQQPLEVAVQGNFSTNETLLLLRATLKGAGIALLPRFAVAKALHDGELIALLPDYQASNLSCYALYLSRQRMPTSLRVLIDYLAEQLRL